MWAAAARGERRWWQEWSWRQRAVCCESKSRKGRSASLFGAVLPRGAVPYRPDLLLLPSFRSSSAAPLPSCLRNRSVSATGWRRWQARVTQSILGTASSRNCQEMGVVQDMCCPVWTNECDGRRASCKVHRCRRLLHLSSSSRLLP